MPYGKLQLLFNRISEVLVNLFFDAYQSPAVVSFITLKNNLESKTIKP
jgi:hypothetical protein